jgi:hypothetical protein
MYVKDSVTNVPIAKPLCDDFIRGGPERARNNIYLTNFPAKNIGLVVATNSMVIPMYEKTRPSA